MYSMIHANLQIGIWRSPPLPLNENSRYPLGSSTGATFEHMTVWTHWCAVQKRLNRLGAALCRPKEEEAFFCWGPDHTLTGKNSFERNYMGIFPPTAGYASVMQPVVKHEFLTSCEQVYQSVGCVRLSVFRDSDCQTNWPLTQIFDLVVHRDPVWVGQVHRSKFRVTD